jgi:hypothetical protein
MSVHSIYYLSREQILELVHRSKKGRLFAVVHRFDELYGHKHFNGEFNESTYEVFINPFGVPKVRMQVTGNSSSYSHDSMSWLSASYYEGADGRSMCWNGKPVGDSWIYEFVPTPDGVKVPNIDSVGVMSMTQSLARNDHFGPVDGVLAPGDEGSFKPMLTVMKLQGSKIKSFGSFMWISRRNDKTILLPKNIVEIVAAKMVGIPRDKAGLKLCINTMKQVVAPGKMSISPKMRLDCIVYGSAMAFVLTLRDEIAVFNELCSPMYKRLYEAFAGVMSLESTMFTCWAPCWNEDQFFNATVEEYNDTYSSVPGPAFDALKGWPEGLKGYESRKELKELKKGATISSTEREDGTEKPQFYPVCTTFSNYIPVVPSASLNNECVSLVNRALMTTPSVDEQLWRDVLELARTEDEKIALQIPDLEKDFESWNSKFPQSKQKLHRIAWESLKTEPLNKRDFIRKMFVKRELTLKGGPEPEDFDPRSIQGNTDRLNVSLGPHTHKVASNLKEVWHVNNEICYTGGLTAEEIGEWRKQFGDEDVTIIELDESRYDAHQGEHAYLLSEGMYVAAGIKEHGDAYYALTSMKEIHGWSSHGINYNVDYTMTSGAPVTSTSNSRLNGIKSKFALNRCGVKDFKMLVHGDDSLIVIRGRFSPDWIRTFKSAFLGIQRSLGFSTKMKISENWCDVEYCSSLFWPVEGGFVLGPKIGKRLPKIGFSLTKLSEGEVKGMLLGLAVEASHIPILRVYVRHQLKLLKRVEKKEFFDRRAIYKSLATEKHKMSEDTTFFFMERYGFDYKELEEMMEACLTDNLTDCVNFHGMSLFTAIDL